MTASNIPSYAPMVGECKGDNEYPLNINNIYKVSVLRHHPWSLLPISARFNHSISTLNLSWSLGTARVSTPWSDDRQDAYPGP